MGSPIFFLPWPFTQFYLHPQTTPATHTQVPMYVPVPMSFDHLDLQRIIGQVISRKQADREREWKAFDQNEVSHFFT